MKAQEFLTEGLKDRVEFLINTFKQENPKADIRFKMPDGSKWPWTGLGNRSRDPGYIYGENIGDVESFWSWLSGLKGAKSAPLTVHNIEGKFEQTIIVKSVLFHKEPKSKLIKFGSTSRLKNKSWN